MPSRDGTVPPPQRSIEELTQMGAGHVRRLRRRQQLQRAAIVGLTLVLAAVAVPVALRTDGNDVNRLGPAGQPGSRVQPDPSPTRDEIGGARDSGRTSIEGSSVPGPQVGTGPRTRAGALEERIAFARYGDESAADLMTARPDGTDVDRITDTGSSESAPTWSPDGDRIAFTSGEYRPADGPHDIFLVDRSADAPERLTSTSSHEADPAWSPDGSRIAFSRVAMGTGEPENSDLYVLDLDSRTTSRVTDTPDASEWGATWSPDGSKLAFQRTALEEEDSPRGIYVIGVDGNGLRRLTSNWDMTPAWSPNGRHIAFARRSNLGGAAPGGVNSYPADSFSIYVVGTDGGNLRRLTTESTVVDHTPSWSPDGTQLAFARDPDGSQDAYATFEFATGARGGPLSGIYVVEADGSGLRQVTDQRNGDTSPDWYGSE